MNRSTTDSEHHAASTLTGLCTFEPQRSIIIDQTDRVETMRGTRHLTSSQLQISCIKLCQL